MNLGRQNETPGGAEHDRSLLELFLRETEAQAARMIERLLELEQRPTGKDLIEALLRDLHSLKGAARVVRLPAIVHLAHTMEEGLVRMRAGRIPFVPEWIDLWMRATDRMQQLARHAVQHSESAVACGQQMETEDPVLRELRLRLEALELAEDKNGCARAELVAPSERRSQPDGSAGDQAVPVDQGPHSSGGSSAKVAPVLRWDLELLDRLMGLASQALAHGHSLSGVIQQLQVVRRRHAEVREVLALLEAALVKSNGADSCAALRRQLHQAWNGCEHGLHTWIEALYAHEQRASQWSHRLYLAVMEARVRPFADAVRRLPRLVRDMARVSGKEIRLVIRGNEIRVDREILERVEAPLMHLVRNAVDHGCEFPSERRANGKATPAVIAIEAELRAHELRICVSDDGRGIDMEALRARVKQAGWLDAASLETASESQLLEFLFRPGFTLRNNVTADSGRGIGLDAVRQAVREMQGRVVVQTRRGQGTTFEIWLPLSLSMVRAVVVEVANEPYAFAARQVSRLMRLVPSDCEELAGEVFVRVDGRPVPLSSLSAALCLSHEVTPPPPWWLVVTGVGTSRRAWQVDRYLGEQELALLQADPMVHTVPGIAGTAVLEDGRPVLLLAPEELSTQVPKTLRDAVWTEPAWSVLGLGIVSARKQVLLADGSNVQRDHIRQILDQMGCVVRVAGDGWEAWRLLRQESFDLVMASAVLPGLDGLELTRRMRQDPRFHSLPVLILNPDSDRIVRQMSCEAGANLCLGRETLQSAGLSAVVASFLR